MLVAGSSSPTLASWWFATVPARRIDLCRRVTFGYAGLWLIARGRYVWDVSALGGERFQPVGVLAWLSQPPPRAGVMLVWLAGVVACSMVVVGRAKRPAVAVGAVAMLLIATLASSFGQVFHTEHLLVIHLLILAIATNIDDATDDTANGWPLNMMMASTTLTYVVAGIAKLRYGGQDWLSGAVLRDWVAVDNLRKVLLADPASNFGGWLAGVGWVWPPIAIFTLVVELGAPLALLYRSTRPAWVTAAWLFHLGIWALMAIAFPYQLSGVAYVAFLHVEKLADRPPTRPTALPVGRPRGRPRDVSARH